MDVDVSLEARALAVASFGQYDALSGPSSQGALGGGFGGGFGVRFARMLTPFVGWEQGWLGCDGCTSTSTTETTFFGLRFDSLNEQTFGFHAAIDFGWRSIRQDDPDLSTRGEAVYGKDPVATYGSSWRWSGFEPRLSVGPTFRANDLFSIDLSLIGSFGRFGIAERVRLQRSGVFGTPGDDNTIPDDVRRTHGFVGLTLTVRALLPVSRTGPSASP